jgi:hypothetical protein
MDDYHEFKCAHEVQIKERYLYWSPNYVSIIMGLKAISGAIISPNSNAVSGSKNVNGNETIGSGGIGLSINTQLKAFFPTFNPIMKFF